MTNNILCLRKAGRLTCTWVGTGDPRNPLACVWTDGKAHSDCKEASASSPNKTSGRMLRCA
jgi:hypothetical protein